MPEEKTIQELEKEIKDLKDVLKKYKQEINKIKDFILEAFDPTETYPMLKKRQRKMYLRGLVQNLYNKSGIF